MPDRRVPTTEKAEELIATHAGLPNVHHTPPGDGELLPKAHKVTHQAGGGDEVDVAGLSGVLADDQHVIDAEVTAVAIAKALLTEQGDIIYENATPTPAALHHGNTGEALLTGGHGANPYWGATAPGIHGAAQHTDITRELFIPANEGHIVSGTRITSLYHSTVQGAANSDQPSVSFTIKVPDDFVSFVSVKAVWSAGVAAGNMMWYMGAAYGASGESIAAHLDEPPPGATATGGLGKVNVQEPANPLTLVNLALGDYLGLEFFRIGSHTSDTLDVTVRLLGLLFTYVANQ